MYRFFNIYRNDYIEIMKKIIFLLLILILSVTCSCSVLQQDSQYQNKKMILIENFKQSRKKKYIERRKKKYYKEYKKNQRKGKHKYNGYFY